MKKWILNCRRFALACWIVVSTANANTITNALWTFPTNTLPAPSAPIGPGLSVDSTNNNLAWVAASTKLGVNFVPRAGQGTALDFSYNGNHPEYLNGSTLTLASTVAGLPTGFSLDNVQLTYETFWSLTGSPITETWAYSVNGGAYINFSTNSINGNSWQMASSSVAGVTLANGDTISFQATITGAQGNNGSLDFDNIQITTTLVPEPSSGALASLGGLATLVMLNRKRF